MLCVFVVKKAFNHKDTKSTKKSARYSMRIGIDASSILPVKTGIGYYTLNLIKSLTKIDQENEYVVLLNSYRHSPPDYPFLNKPNVRVRRWRIPGPLLIHGWRHLHFPPIGLLVGKVDVFHSPGTYIPPQIRGKRVTTIHDLYFLKHPEQCATLGGKFLAATVPRRIHKMDRIIVDSLSSKADVMALLGVPEEKISVIYLGVDQIGFRPISDTGLLALIREEYCLPPNYILTVATLEPRKNLDGLLFAYKRLKAIVQSPPKLVIVGRTGWQSEKIFDTVRELDLHRDVIFTGYVSDAHLPILYNCALLFIYPSLYEGFGLPVLEAMACGLPVIVSDTASLREIAGESAILVDPENYYAIAEKMKDLIVQHSLRERLREKSLAQAKQFSWDLCARKTLNVYKQVAGK
jgi:glycosyltransferase involved in cell wall biosynthesis